MVNAFAGRSYIITGAASGIGRATAGLLKQRGASLSLWDQNAERLDAVGSVLVATQSLAVDVTDANAIQVGMAEAATHLGEIHGVIHAAGILHIGCSRKLLSKYTGEL